MNEQPAAPPSLPTKKKINHKLLWLALMGPIAVVGLLFALTLFGVKYDFITSAFLLGSPAILGGWILFGFALFKRMPTAGYVLCLVGYPLIQFAICFTLFFLGCVNTWDGNWGHSAPDSWVEEQERRRRENPIDPVKLEEAKEALEETLRQQEERNHPRSGESLPELERDSQPTEEAIARPLPTDAGE